MCFAEIIKLLASPAKTQTHFLCDVPENARSVGYSKYNDVYRMALLYLESCGPSASGDACEEYEHWLQRTQIATELLADRQHPLWLSNVYLHTALTMIHDLDKSFLYSQHGLRSAHEWKLARHLAGNVCNAMDWKITLEFADFSQLWEELGADIIYCPT